MKLSKTMKRAYQKLSVNWMSAYELGERLPTLDGLVKRGLADRKFELGTLFSPTVHTKYRLVLEEQL